MLSKLKLNKSARSIYYWVIWGIEVITLIFVEKYYNQNQIEIPYYIFYVYAIGTWSFVAIINLYEQLKLSKYVKKFHADKMIKVTYEPFHFQSNIKLSFILSKENFDDERLRNIKWNCRSSIILALAVFVSFIVFRTLL